MEYLKFIVLLCVVSSVSLKSHADQLRVAVASNFVGTIAVLKKQFEQQSDHTLLLSAGSSGKHYAQIKNGAPFDIFLSADSQRPLLLEQQGIALADTRFTYAIGRLVLWGTQAPLDNQAPLANQGSLAKLGPQVLNTDESSKPIAIANPRLAPYGRAARQTLNSLGQWRTIEKRLVRGTNINQTYQFVVSGNAQFGLLSRSQLIASGQTDFWLVPQNLHAPIEQQGIMLKDSSAGRMFLAFMRSKQALQIITQQGYDTP